MKLSTNFLKDYVDIDVDVKTLAEDMTRAGNEYDDNEYDYLYTLYLLNSDIELEYAILNGQFNEYGSIDFPESFVEWRREKVEYNELFAMILKEAEKATS